MYHVILKDGTRNSYAHPTVSTVSGDTRTIWQTAEDGGDPMEVASYPTADIAATVDCLHEEEECVCVEAVMQQLNPPTESGVEIAARKLRSAQRSE